MKYTEVTNLRWNIDNTAIECEVVFTELGILPFGASPNDTLPHGIEIYNRCIAGDFGPIAKYVKQPDEYPQPLPPATEPQPIAEGVQTL